MASVATSTNEINVVRHVVLYDGECPMCAFQVRLLTWLDWFNVAWMLPLTDPLARRLAPNLSRVDLMAAIHCVTPEGDIYRGARCIRFIGMRIPLLAPLALILWIPGVIWVAEKVYAMIARNRYVISEVFGCKDACAILPERKRDEPPGSSDSQNGG